MNDNEKKDNEQKLKYSILKSFAQPFWVISDNINTFMKQGCVFSLLMVIISYLLGQKYFCLFNDSMKEKLYCPETINWYVLYLFVKITVVSIFVNVWYNTVFKKVAIDKYYLKSMWKVILKTMVLLLVFIVLNIMPLISGAVLFMRTPNPVWQLELMFFTFVSIGFLLPFVSLRFCSLFAVLLDTGKITEVKEIWNRGKGLTVKILISISLIYMMCLLSFISVTGYLNVPRDIPGELYNIIAELFFAFMSYFIVILFITFCEKQRQTFLQ